jgi:hypothetical protein
MSSSPVAGGGGKKLVDHLRRGSLRDRGQPLDLEEVLEVFLGRFALIALTGENPEQVSALSLGHRFAAVAGRRGVTRRSGRLCGDRAIATRSRGTGWSCWPRIRSGASPVGLEAHAVQLLEGDDADIDSVTEGAGLGPGFSHADQVRDEELIDVLGTGVTDAFEEALAGFDFGLGDGRASIILGWYLDQ